jgi:hypothetical protein
MGSNTRALSTQRYRRDARGGKMSISIPFELPPHANATTRHLPNAIGSAMTD